MNQQFAARVQELQHRLLDLGYRPFQLDQIIEEAANYQPLAKLTPEEATEVIKALEDYVIFAEKSRMSK